MRFGTSCVVPAVCILLVAVPSAAENVRSRLLREYAVKNGLVPAESIKPEIDTDRSAIGGLLFKDQRLSLNSNISCQSCHLDQFSSADGLPVAVGVKGMGSGAERLKSGGTIVPRNTLPLWGRGSLGFEVFFWDGKVERHGDTVESQFGNLAPSRDPLVVAVHLPVVEIREMVLDDSRVREEYERESVEAAREIHEILAERIRSDPVLGPRVAGAYGVNVADVTFGQLADSIAHFIRDRFAVTETRFHRFVFSGQELSDTEIAGGLIFYGKGRCSECHRGPLFTDFAFYSLPFPQAGFGKNGFGVDYGRFNVTHEARDIYKFRTPSLINAGLTAPYSHSGAVSSLADAIAFHFDPLGQLDVANLQLRDRLEYYNRLRAWASSGVAIPALDSDEVRRLVAFLNTLTFDDRRRISDSDAIP